MGEVGNSSPKQSNWPCQ